MKCPRCQTGITSAPDPTGFLVCPGCGARLRKNSAAPAAAAARRASPLAGSPVEIDGMLTRLDAPAPSAVNPSATLPPGTPMPRIPRSEPATGPRAVADPMPARAAAATAPAAAISGPRPVPRAVPAPAADSPVTAIAMDTLLSEVRAVRELQEQTLELLRDGRPRAFEGGSMGMSFDTSDEAPAPEVPVVRSRRRKSALVIDDDEATCAAMVAALEHGDIPVRSVADGNLALAAIAEDKPDVIVLELAISGASGAMGGKDVVNVIKATMEWVDVPIILYTRVPVENQREARTIHGADDYVLKGDGAPAAVVAKAIIFFRKG